MYWQPKITMLDGGVELEARECCAFCYRNAVLFSLTLPPAFPSGIIKLMGRPTASRPVAVLRQAE